MKTISLKKIAAVLTVSAGILSVDMMPAMAQSTSGQGNSSTSSPNNQQNNGATNQNSSNQNSTGSQNMQGKSMNNASMDAIFIRKASEGNLAEVELGTMALEKASSQEVKDFAQQMIDHHTKANEKLISIVSGSAGNASSSQNVPSTDDNSGNAGMSTNKKSGNMSSGGVSSNPGNTSDNTTQQGNTSDDANMNDNDQQSTTQSGSISSRTDDNTVQGNNESNTRSNDADRNISDGTGGGGTGANSGGTTSSTSTSREGATNMNEGATDNTGAGTSDQTGLHSDSGNLRTGTGGSGVMYGTSESGNGGFDNPIAIKLAPEHVAIKKKLSALSGAEFDKAYMQAMVNDHAKTVELFETQISKGQKAELVSFAKNGLPMIREHYQKAQALTGSKGNMNKGSSTNKSSGSKQ